MKTCIHCEDEFDPNSKEKKRAGGKVNECPSCSEETEVKYVGLQAADGKQSQATILKFESENDKTRYVNFWRNNMGMHKGKNCTLGNHLSTDPGIKFKTVVAHVATNSKGKL